MTLVELLVASSLLIVLLTLVLVTFNLFINVTNTVTAQYQEFDQALPALAPLQALLRAEVEPAPTAYQPGNAAAPTPAYSSVGNFWLVFYSNVGNPDGPALIKAGETDTTGAPTSTCTTASPCEFQVQEYLPSTDANGVTYCPVGPSPVHNACQYLSPYKLIVNVIGVVNDPTQIDVGTGSSIFTYSVFDTANTTAFTLTPDQVKNQVITGLNTSDPKGVAGGATTASMAACTVPNATHLSIATSCPTDAIQSVGVFLQISKKGAGLNGTVENQTIVYRYPESTGTGTYPYQYTTAVG